ncbi:MAG: hypothetical protein KatS3mg027_0162 [Bacteroidia bacterium]|nr:MAG: hypothetical protein KatS3mg027_0162 [Bacteroidia bacterium]
MKKSITVVCSMMLLSMNVIFSQNVGINSTGALPNASAGLDVDFTNKGILIPRVNLTAVNNPAPITSPAVSLLVYNTNAAITGGCGVGYYYWNGTQWVCLLSSTGSSGGSSYAWLTTGNAGTNPLTNFLGTTDNNDLVIKTNNSEIARFTAGWRVGIGTATPNGKLDVRTSTLNNGIYVESTTNAGNGVYAFLNATGATYGVWGRVNSTSNGSKGVYGENQATSGVNFGIDGRVYSNDAHAVRGYNSSTTAPTLTNSPGTAIYGQNDAPQSITIWGVSNNNSSTLQSYVLWGETRGAKSIGVVGVGNGTSAQNIPSSGAGGYFTGTEIGTFSYANNTSGDRRAFYAMWRDNIGNIRTAMVGGFVGGTEYKVMGNGAVSTIVKDKNQQERIMFAPEAPQVLLQDMGKGKLVNGKAYITLDEIFSNNIIIDENHPAHIFIQPLGDCNGVYVKNISNKGFEVVELMNGKSNIEFSWFIIAIRKDEVDPNGNVISKYQDIRFPFAPEPVKGIDIKHQLPAVQEK